MKYYVTNYCILFNEKNEFLSLKYKGGNWALPGGHLEHGENWRDALLREIKEEIDVNPDEIELISPIFVNNWDYEGKYYFGTTHLGYIKTDIINLSHEHDQFKWVTKDGLQNLTPEYPDFFKIVESAYRLLKL